VQHQEAKYLKGADKPSTMRSHAQSATATLTCSVEQTVTCHSWFAAVVDIFTFSGIENEVKTSHLIQRDARRQVF
jgi:hypothetical protein